MQILRQVKIVMLGVGLAVWSCGLYSASAVVAARQEKPATTQGEQLFLQKVWPVLEKKCLSCHGEAKLASDWTRTPIDAFVLQKLNANGMKSAPPADRRTLLRRAYFDLTGLPPTLEEIKAFLADTSPDAYEKVVDRLLSSPRYGVKCLLARRLVGKGVRFVQIFSGKAESDIRQDWDAHEVCDNLHVRMGRGVDKPIAGLLTHLKQRGLLDSTLVIWGGEFGRTPFTNGGAGNGRDHNPYGFTMWMAGGGVKGGRVIGSTDEIGLRATEQPKHIHDIHATWLTLLGLDHKKLTFLFQGRNQRLTDIGGEHEFSKELLS